MANPDQPRDEQGRFTGGGPARPAAGGHLPPTGPAGSDHPPAGLTPGHGGRAPRLSEAHPRPGSSSPGASQPRPGGSGGPHRLFPGGPRRR